MKGHTHEDVDQAFSRVSTTIGRTNVCSYSELHMTLTKCFTPKPDILQLNAMYDIKEWMKDLNPGIHNIVYPHCFKISASEEGVYLTYKNWDCDSDWLPDSQGKLLIPVNILISF